MPPPLPQIRHNIAQFRHSVPWIKAGSVSPRTVSRQIDGEHLSAPGADNAGKIRPFLLAAALAVDEQPDALRIFAVQYGRDLIDVKKRLLHCRIPSIASRATAMSFKISGRMLSR